MVYIYKCTCTLWKVFLVCSNHYISFVLVFYYFPCYVYFMHTRGSGWHTNTLSRVSFSLWRIPHRWGDTHTSLTVVALKRLIFKGIPYDPTWFFPGFAKWKKEWKMRRVLPSGNASITKQPPIVSSSSWPRRQVVIFVRHVLGRQHDHVHYISASRRVDFVD